MIVKIVVYSFMEREVEGETLLKLTPDLKKDLIPSFKYLVKETKEVHKIHMIVG